MIGLIAIAIAVTVGGQILLVASVVRRLRTGESLTATLREHAVVPRWARSSVVAASVETAQAALGLAGLAMVGLGWADGAAFAVVCAATAALFGGFATYLVIVARRRGLATCSCLGNRGRVDAAAVIRAGVFAVAAAAAAWLGVPANVLTWPVVAALVGAGVLVAGFAVFLVALAQAVGGARTDAPTRARA
ncbi:MAG TPA: MauE/DoxX family redox-associated membrane protein [Jiangellales bacterium]|nr:MauE/DoxX family redox-associated membrane protein [Jiangellales bacterium]